MRYITLLLTFFLLSISIPAFSQSWQSAKKIDGSRNANSAGVAVDRDGNSYVIGSFRGTITLDTITIAGGNTLSVFVAKYNTSGNIIWAKKAASAIDSVLDAVGIEAVAADGSGHIYITGNYLGSANFFGSQHTSIGSSEIYIAKLTDAGDLIWLQTAGGNGVGNYNQNQAYALCLDGAGNCFLTGRYFTTALFDTITISAALPNELFIAKYNTEGRIVWAKSGGGDFGLHNGFGIACDKEGNSYATGNFFGHLSIDSNIIDASDAEQKMFVAKFSPEGKTLWAKEIGSGGYYGIAAGISVDTHGNAYIGGFFRSTINFGQEQLTFNRNVIAYAMLAMKYDSGGNFLWAKMSEGANQSTQGYGICIDPQGNSFITGSFSKQASFGTTTLSKDSGVATFITKLDPQGKFLWAKQTGGIGNNYGNGIALAASGEIIIAGNFSDSVAFDSKTLSSSGVTDGFISSLTEPSDGVADPDHKMQSAEFYPNPANRSVHFLQKQSITMFDVLGREVLRCHDCDELIVENIPSGSYYLNGQLVIIHH